MGYFQQGLKTKLLKENFYYTNNWAVPINSHVFSAQGMRLHNRALVDAYIERQHSLVFSLI